MFRFVILLLIGLLGSPPATAHEDPNWRATYLANSGVMVTVGDTKVLFDPFFRDDFGQFERVPVDMEAAIFDGSAPWDGVDAIFISHHHGDHFDPAVVRAYLRQWPAIELYAPRQAVNAMLTPAELQSKEWAERVYAVELERDSQALKFSMGGLLVEALRIAHAGWPDRHADVHNIVFRVTPANSSTIMHLGDADSDRQHYALHESFWRARGTDLALVPVWLMLTDSGRVVLDQTIDAGHTLGVHVYRSVPDEADKRPPQFDGLDIFTKPGEIRHAAK